MEMRDYETIARNQLEKIRSLNSQVEKLESEIREFKLLVREYFQEMDVIAHIKRNGYVPDLKRRDDLEKQIRKELSRFTQQEQEELPFKD